MSQFRSDMKVLVQSKVHAHYKLNLPDYNALDRCFDALLKNKQYLFPGDCEAVCLSFL